MAQQRSHVRIEKKCYSNRNISYIWIYITYFNPDVLQVGIARLTYMVIKHRPIEILYLK